MVEVPYRGVAPARTFPVERFVAHLTRYWWVPALGLLLGLGAGTSYGLWLTPIYVSTARLWETEKLHLPEGATFTEDPQNSSGTQAELLRSRKLCELALGRLQASGSNAVPKGKDGKPMLVSLRISQTPRSTVFAVEASSANPGYTQTFLDALLHEYIEYKKTVRKVVSGDTLASISEQVLRLETELKGYQEALTAFQRTNNLAVLQEEGNIAGEYLARLRTQLSDYKLEAQLLEATALEKDRTTAGGIGGVGPGLVSSSDPGSGIRPGMEQQTVLKELEVLKAQRAQSSKYLKPKHPRIVKLDADIERGQKVIDMFRNQTREQLELARQGLKLKLDSVLASIQEWEARVTEANARIAEAERLKLNVNRTQTLYERLVTLLQNVDISRSIDQATLAVLEPASPAMRSYRQVLTGFGLATVAGFGMGLGLVGLSAVRDDRFYSAAEITEKFEANLIGQIPDLTELEIPGVTPLLSEVDARHWYAESYRSLRSALRFYGPQEQRLQVVLITSAVSAEGKSTVAINLARVLAQGGSRVLLVDGDLRRGRLHELVSLKRDRGLADLLQEPREWNRALQSNSLPNWTFLSRGRDLSNPGDLLLSPHWDRLLVRLREHYDYVLIDSSPIFVADDATTLAPKADGTLFVVRHRFSRSRAVREALDLLYQRQARVLGLVLNRVGASARPYYEYKNAKDTPGRSQEKPPATSKERTVGARLGIEGRTPDTTPHPAPPSSVGTAQSRAASQAEANAKPQSGNGSGALPPLPRARTRARGQAAQSTATPPPATQRKPAKGTVSPKAARRQSGASHQSGGRRKKKS